MQFSTAFALIAGIAATVAQAVPQGYDTGSSSSSSVGFGQCDNNKKVACCTAGKGNGNDGLLGDVLGGSCIVPGLGVLGVGAPTCTGANTYCCPTTQSGLLDLSLSCSPIQLKLR